MTATAWRLRQLQRWFSSVTTHPRGVLEGQRLERLVTKGPQQSAAERLQIYADGYVARLRECLADDYPALVYLLGDDAFSALARQYIEKYPSRSRSLNAYGRELSALCRTRREPWAGLAADLARLEWALVEIVHEPASASLSPETLAHVRWQTARLVPSPALRVLSFEYPVNRFYQAFRDGQAPARPLPAPSATAVYRQGLALWRMDLEPRAARLLAALVSGAPLAASVAALEGGAPPATAGDLVDLLPKWLGAWVQSGFFCRVA